MLLTPLDLGPLTLPNRAWMAPLTRSRHQDTIPHPLAPTYYAQRASAGLIVSEATQVTPRGQGYPNTPGIHSDAQVEAWRRVTDAVHAAGGRIVCQLWHVGRVSHSAYHDGEPPLAPSAIAASGKAMLPDFSMTPFETPRAMTEAEIDETIRQFAEGAERAREAGFDGVEVHGANGYLIEQFLSTSSNQRSDGYGGSASNRVRFLDDVVGAVVRVWSPERTGVRLSFGQGANGATDDNPEETFGLVAERLAAHGVAYVHGIVPGEDSGFDALRTLRNGYSGVVVANGGIDREKGEAILAERRADAIAFGRPWLANPDLLVRFEAQANGLEAPLNEADSSTYYGGGAKGYTDYPLWDGTEAGSGS
ncbi:MAG: alkene reductase [Rubricoccaceae bacterium]